MSKLGYEDGEKMFEEFLISGNEEPTVHSKIFRANEDYISNDELQDLVKRISEYIDQNNTSMIVKEFRSYVSGFKG